MVVCMITMTNNRRVHLSANSCRISTVTRYTGFGGAGIMRRDKVHDPLLKHYLRPKSGVGWCVTPSTKLCSSFFTVRRRVRSPLDLAFVFEGLGIMRQP